MPSTPTMTINQAIGDTTRVVPITLNLNVENAVAVRYGATAQEAALAEWKPYSSTIMTYGRGDEPGNPLDYYAQVKLADNSIISLHALEPTRLAGTPNYPSASINTDFSTWNNFWVSYNYDDNVNEKNTFFALTHEAGKVWADDSRWGIDSPETPDTALFAMNYAHWITNGAQNTIDLTNKTLSVDFDFSQIDLKGGQVDFWVLAEDNQGHGRYHLLDVPIHDGHNSIALNFDAFDNSWLNDGRALGSVSLDATRISSWGFGFSGFSSEPTGIITFDNFAFGGIINGTNANDQLYGSAVMDEFHGFAGNDMMWGFEGNDLFYGNSGADVFTGGTGLDTACYVQSASGVTVYLDSSSPNSGGDAKGDLFGSIENVIGSPFADQIHGDNAANYLYGQEGNDMLWGDAGDDYLYGHSGADVFTGGSGIDTVVYNGTNSAIAVNLATSGTQGDANGDLYGSIENVIGSPFNDTITGDNGNNTLHGLDGNDTLNGSTGNDTLYGQNGDDTLNGEQDQDTLTGGAGSDTFSFTNLTDSTPSAPDTITDFESADAIDLRTIDANQNSSGNQTFTYINGNFTGTAGELHVVNNGSLWVIEGDVNGDSASDFQILSVNSVDQSDFLL